jgi:hypothetical protein
MLTRVNQIACDTPTLKVGIGGNYYVFCDVREPLEEVCVAINKSINSIRWHTKHSCFVFRVRTQHHKQRLGEIFNL